MKSSNPFAVDFGTIVSQIRTGCIVGKPQDGDPTESSLEKEVTAIWDTGAQMSSISGTLAKSLGLEPIDIIQVEGVHGLEESKIYLVNITPPVGIRFFSMFVTEARMNSADILIGMDIIRYGDFLITNGCQKTVMKFQVPPREY